MRRLDRLHALAMLLALVVATASSRMAVLSVTAVALFAVRVVRDRPRWISTGGFGPANGVTALRITIIAGLAWLPQPIPWAGFIVGLTFALDGLDGLLARRTGMTSEFGAQFDQEADAYTVAAATSLAHHCGAMPLWFLVPGVLRYLYVLAVWGLGAPREAPRSRWGRWAYSLWVVGLVAVLVVPTPWTRVLASLGSIGLVASFSHSFWAVLREAHSSRRSATTR